MHIILDHVVKGVAPCTTSRLRSHYSQHAAPGMESCIYQDDAMTSIFAYVRCNTFIFVAMSPGMQPCDVIIKHTQGCEEM